MPILSLHLQLGNEIQIEFSLFSSQINFFIISSFARTTEFLQNEESQSSLHSSTSATIEGSARKQRSKIEVVDPEG